ncbi:kinase-like domain-containing protein [Hyaloraphidium curvatum]|nr:kinase-like domain-containing protein [Hyaloraphidium curvatum]
MATICNAVMYLHRHGIAHRDLKPANLLLRDGSENAALCLVDFNAGYIVPEAADGQAGSPGGSGAVPQFVSKTSMQTVTGTPFYLAPEIVLGQAYSTAVDAWSLGCIAYQLLVGVTPFQGSASYEQLYAKILNADYTFPPDVPLSPLARDFVQCLLVADPGPRASAEQALAHPWIQTLVPHGYLMLLQQFNHEASPGVFPPPTRYEPPPPVSSASGRTGSAEWRLKQAALAVAGFPNGSSSGSGASPAWRMPSAEAGAAATALDAEFGRTLRTRWESRGRPGILQVPDAAVFEHEELFGFAGGDPSPASPVSAAPQSPQPDAPHPHTPPSHVVPLADSSDLPNLAPMRRALSQKLDAHAAELRAASTRLDANSAARPGAAAGAGAGGLLDPSSAAGPGPAEADRAPSGFQVFWSASGALYVNEAEKERLREAAEGEVSDEDEGEAVVQVHVTPPPPRVEAREGKISMLDAFGRAGPLWEWETEDKG